MDAKTLAEVLILSPFITMLGATLWAMLRSKEE